MSNRYTSANSAIVAADGMMFNESTTSNNNHYNKPTTNNDSTNQIIGRPIRIRRYGKSNKKH